MSWLFQCWTNDEDRTHGEQIAVGSFVIEHGWSPVTCTVAFAILPGDTFSNSDAAQIVQAHKSSATSCDDKPGAADVIVDSHATPVSDR